MNITEYGKKLALVKKNYDKVQEENAKFYKNDLKNLKKRHKEIQGSQRENYDKQASKLKSQNNEKYDYYSKKSKSVIEKRKADYLQSLNQLKEKYEKGFQDQKVIFENRLRDLSVKFQISQDAHEKISKSVFDTRHKKYLKNVKFLNDDFERKLEKNKEHSNKVIDKVEKNAMKNKREFIKENELEKSKILLDNKIKLKDVEEESEFKVDGLNRFYEKQLALKEDRFRHLIGDQKRDFEERIEVSDKRKKEH